MNKFNLILSLVALGQTLHAAPNFAITFKNRLNSLPFVEISDLDLQSLESLDNTIYKHPINTKKAKKSLKSLMPDIRDQEDRPTCSSFAAIALIEPLLGKGNLSEQCLAYFSHNEDGSNAGQHVRWASKHPLYLEDDCPYKGQPRERSVIPNLSRAEKIYISEEIGFFFYPLEREDALDIVRDLITKESPVAMGIYTIGDEWDYSGIIDVPTKKQISAACIRNPKSGRRECRSHAIVITGFNDDEQFFEFRNSWGEDWPINGPLEKTGYGKISYAYFNKMKVHRGELVAPMKINRGEPLAPWRYTK